jgi:hypothetical protein
MWAHYAASHRGFVIGFKPGYAPLKKRTNEQYLSEGELQPVTYVQARVTLPADRIDLPIDQLYTKGQSWEYEEEWRVVRYLEKCDVAVPSPPGDPRVFLCDIDPAAIARVDIGEPGERRNKNGVERRNSSWIAVRARSPIPSSPERRANYPSLQTAELRLTLRRVTSCLPWGATSARCCPTGRLS